MCFKSKNNRLIILPSAAIFEHRRYLVSKIRGDKKRIYIYVVWIYRSIYTGVQRASSVDPKTAGQRAKGKGSRPDREEDVKAPPRVRGWGTNRGEISSLNCTWMVLNIIVKGRLSESVCGLVRTEAKWTLMMDSLIIDLSHSRGHIQRKCDN